MRFLRSLRRNRPTFDAPLSPAVPFFAIGDIHGRADLLERLLVEVPADQKLVFVGDYIDRGEDSADVLRRLMTLQAERGEQVVCLIGNHEVFLLDFLDGSKSGGSGWLRHGGLQTLSSFGAAIPVGDDVSGASWAEARRSLSEAMGPEMVAWVRTLPALWHSGNVCVVHAGADPGRHLEDQSRDDFIWGHPDFETKPRMDGTWIIHGHTIVPEPRIKEGRISIDTGAYASGRLTAVQIRSDRAEFVTVQ